MLSLLLPWNTATRLLDRRSHSFPLSPWTVRLGALRALAAFGTAVYLTVAFRTPGEMILQAVGNTAEIAGIAFVVVLVLGVVVYLGSDASHRVDLRTGMRSSLWTIGLALVTLVPPSAVLVTNFSNVAGPGAPVSAYFAQAGLAIQSLMVIALIWWLVYLVFAIIRMWQSVYSIAEMHPMLAPICACAAIAVKAVIEMATFDTDGLPPDIWLTTTSCGLAATVVLCVLEYFSLRGQGLRLFAGPYARQEPYPA